MLRLASYDIVFQEVPDEVTLALNISGCPNDCDGCHSPHLRAETGKILDRKLLASLLDVYGNSVTCVCFMGGDAAPEEVMELAAMVKESTSGRLKTAWYSGRDELTGKEKASRFDYIKIGRYDKRFGGLDSPETNQRFYKVVGNALEDITWKLRKSSARIVPDKLRIGSPAINA